MPVILLAALAWLWTVEPDPAPGYVVCVSMKPQNEPRQQLAEIPTASSAICDTAIPDPPLGGVVYVSVEEAGTACP